VPRLFFGDAYIATGLLFQTRDRRDLTARLGGPRTQAGRPHSQNSRSGSELGPTAGAHRTASFGLVYWALVRVQAGRAQVILALVPLLTLLLAIAHRQERLHWSGVGGAILALLGVGTIFWSAAAHGGDAPAGSIAALLAAAVCIAEAAVLIKSFPRVHPATLNAVAMAVGAAILLLISAIAQERWSVPSRPETWVALGFLSVIGSVIVFSLYLFILGRWPASTSSYSFVLFPIVAVILSAQMDREPLSLTLLVGGVLVISGVYLGALVRSPSAT
jgi:drug/metabolite transporter (DMT)-like permease